MTSSVLYRVVGRACQFAGLSLFVPAAVALYFGEDATRHYASTATVAVVLGFAIVFFGGLRDDSSDRLTRREGFLAVAATWALIVLFGAIPFWLSGAIPYWVDALFESASGFSTTGATILSDIEALPRAHLFQRSFAHWIGGMGIVVLSVAILPELAVGGMQLFSAEASGITTDKLSPRIVSTARRLWQVYVGMTVVLVGLLILGGMDWYDSVTHAFGTIATGGFSTRNASIGAFDSLYIETIITLFMLASGISFALHYRLFLRAEAKPMIRSTEVRIYLLAFIAFAGAIAVNLTWSGVYENLGSAFRYAAFQTAAIITTTGYGTADFDRWPDFSRYLLVILMFVGGCAGSTAGGCKIVRLLVVFKHAGVELKKLLYPGLVHPVTVANRSVTQSTIQGILGFFLLYITTIVIATTLVLATGVDLVTGTTAVISAMNSIGPGLDLVGPTQNYAHLPDSCKLILCACMLLGRLEIYTVLVLFTPSFWRR